MKANISIAFRSSLLPTMAAAYVVLLVGRVLWPSLLQEAPGATWHTTVEELQAPLILTLNISILLCLLHFRYVLRPILAFLIISASLVSSFIHHFGANLGKLLEANFIDIFLRDTSELLVVSFAADVLFLGVIPSYLLYCVDVKFSSFRHQLQINLSSACVSILLGSMLLNEAASPIGNIKLLLV